MSKILGVKFCEIGKINYFECNNFDISKEDFVVAQTRKGEECGEVTVVRENLNVKTSPDEFIIRKATAEDLDSLKKKKQEEDKALKICEEKIKHHKLKMKLIGAEYTFNRAKLIFYFTSESRVDFRSLVKDLAYVFKVRIELRQIGVREEARLLGGMGICGRPICCSSFLPDFENVCVKMARNQGMSLNPVKLSGMCGRLKCCLKYEDDVYLNLLDQMPKIGTIVETAEGNGVVVNRFPISSEVKVQLEDSAGNSRIKSFKLEDVSTLYECEE